MLRDLSHDLDYALWLFGPWTRVVALGGRHSELDIDSDDIFALLFETRNCPVVNVQLSYLDRRPRRQIVVNTRRHTFAADLIAGTLSVDARELELMELDRDTTYRAMHHAVICGETGTVCDVAAGLEVLALIEGAERSVADGVWIGR